MPTQTSHSKRRLNAVKAEMQPNHVDPWSVDKFCGDFDNNRLPVFKLSRTVPNQNEKPSKQETSKLWRLTEDRRRVEVQASLFDPE